MNKTAAWKRIKNNVVVYNLKEGANQQADKDSAIVLLHSLLECDINFTKLFRQGRPSNNRVRLLLIVKKSSLEFLLLPYTLDYLSSFPECIYLKIWQEQRGKNIRN